MKHPADFYQKDWNIRLAWFAWHCRAAAVIKKTLVRLKKVESFALISKAIIPTKISFAL